MKKIHFGFRMSTSILVLLPLITLSCFVQNAIAFAFKSSNSILGSRYFRAVEATLALHDNYSAIGYSTTKTYATSELDAELLSQGNEDAGDKVAKRRDNGRDYDDQGDYLKQTETTIRGIGGEGGLVYDVNKVKRNLVQEAVRAYKNELLYLLATPSVDLLLREYYDSEVQQGTSKLLPSTAAYIRSKDAANIESVIEEKLASLVRNNPVSTTTDSNLLEGTWEVAFMARNASKVLLWQPSYLSDRSVVRQSDDWQNTHSSIGTGQTVSPLQSFTRTYHLENVDADQDAYVVDCNRRLGRLFMVSERTYTVSRLTRTSLELTLSSSSRRMLSSLFHVERDWNEEDNEKIQFNGEKDISTLSATAASKNSKRPKTLNVQILYLDSDLCVCVERFVDQDDSRPRGTSKSSSFDGKLVVYTKSKVWTGRKERFDRTKRFLAIVPKLLGNIHSPYNFRRRIANWIRKYAHDMDQKGDSAQDKFYYSKSTDTSIVKVLKLGEPTLSDLEEPSWEGDEDPFVQLDADTRQETMKLLSIAEIEEAGRIHKRMSQKFNRRDNKRKKILRPPPETD